MIPDFKLVTPPEQLPVTVGEAKGQIRETAADPVQDVALTRYIRATTEWAEHFTRRHLIHQVWDLRFRGFPARHCEFLHRADEIRLPRVPLKAWDVTPAGSPPAAPNHIKYLDGAGAQQALVHGTDYIVTDGEPAVILPVEGKSWPSTYPQLNASGQWPVEVRCTFGYGADGSAVPDRFKQALLLVVGHWYNHREDHAGDSIPQAILHPAESLLWQLRFDPW